MEPTDETPRPLFRLTRSTDKYEKSSHRHGVSNFFCRNLTDRVTKLLKMECWNLKLGK